VIAGSVMVGPFTAAPSAHAGLPSSRPDTKTASFADHCSELPLPAPVPGQYGSEVYTYHLGRNEIVFRVPPRSLRLTSVGPTVLRWFGFGTAPKSVTAKEEWTRSLQIRHVVPRLCTSNFVNETAQGASPALAGSGPAGTPDTSDNWSGILDTASTGKPFPSINGNWHQSGFKTYCTDAYDTDWVGLGGYNFVNGQQRLIQAGTTTDGGTSPIYFFTEYLTENSNGVITGGESHSISLSGKINPGDVIYSQASYPTASETGTGSPALSFYVTDDQQGTSDNPGLIFSTSGPDGTFYDGTTAEWIDETGPERGSF
jgi:hypothetical protein